MNELLPGPKYQTFHPWNSLSYIIGHGQNEFRCGFTGKVILQINQGGIQNRDISAECKEKFRVDVSPWLSESANISGEFTGKIIADVLNGDLKKAVFYPKI